MSFNKDHLPKPEPVLLDIKDDVEPALAVFSDRSVLKFPAGTKFAHDNHLEHGMLKQVRELVQPPAGHHFWLSPGFGKNYVAKAIAKAEQDIKNNVPMSGGLQLLEVTESDEE